MNWDDQTFALDLLNFKLKKTFSVFWLLGKFTKMEKPNLTIFNLKLPYLTLFNFN
jgi:hypothetical protein